MLCTLESSCLLDDDEEKEDDEDVEEDDKADISCKRFSLADQLLLVPFFFLDGKKYDQLLIHLNLSSFGTHWTIKVAVTNLCCADQFKIILRSAIPARYNVIGITLHWCNVGTIGIYFI